MPTLYQLKPRFQNLLRPLVAAFARAGITANQVTLATCATSLALGAWLAIEHRGWILLPIFLFLRMALNAIDGMLATEFGQKSKLGAILNELTDVLSDAALAFPIATLPGWNPLAVAAAIFFAALTEMAGLLGLAIGGPRRYDGPFGKSDRAFVLGFFGSWLALDWPVSESVRTAVPFLWIALCCWTITQRVRRALG